MAPVGDIQIEISPLATIKLKWLLEQEQHEGDEELAYHVIPLTSGCSTPSFGLELTELKNDRQWIVANDIPFICDQEDAWMDGLIINLDRETGKFSIYHPRPPQMGNCPAPL